MAGRDRGIRVNVDGTNIGLPENAMVKQQPARRSPRVEATLLSTLELRVGRRRLPLSLCGHAVEALWTLLRTGKRNIADGACDATVPIFNGMDREEPDMGKAGCQQRIDVTGCSEPCQESVHRRRKLRGRRGFVMHLAVSDGSGSNLHRTTGIVAPVKI